MSAPHKLYFSFSNGGFELRIECPGPEVGSCQIYEEGDSCECTCPTCTSGEHWGCDDAPSPIDDLGGPPCKYQEVPGCGIVEGGYWGELGRELLHGDFPESWPILADVEWDDGYPALVPWKAPS